MRTHEGGFEEVAGEEDLVGGGEGAELGGAAADLEHAVEGGRQHDGDGGGDSLHHDGAPPALQTVQPQDRQLPQRRPEQQHQHHPHLRTQHREQQLDHSLSILLFPDDDLRFLSNPNYCAVDLRWVGEEGRTEETAHTSSFFFFFFSFFFFFFFWV